LLLTPAEAAIIEKRVLATPPLLQLNKWNHYVLVFEKVGSDDGDKVWCEASMAQRSDGP
jgi:hypothetical protein